MRHLFEAFYLKKPAIPLVIARGGLASKYQENTYSALKAALDVKGCAGICLSVALTRDGVPVLSADEDLFRLTNEFNSLVNMDFAQLERLKISTTISSGEITRSFQQSEKFLSLEQALFELAGLDFLVFLNAGTHQHKPRNQMAAIAAAKLVQQQKMQQQAVIFSGSIGTLKYLKQHFDQVATGFAADMAPVAPQARWWLARHWLKSPFLKRPATQPGKPTTGGQQWFGLTDLPPVATAMPATDSEKLPATFKTRAHWLETEEPDKLLELQQRFTSPVAGG